MRNLLTHTAGFVEDNPWGDRQQVMTEAEFTALLNDGRVVRPHARAWRWNIRTSATRLLGRIITNVSGMRYQDYIRPQIMLPLGMTSTGYDIFASPVERSAIGYRWIDNRWVREPDMKDGAFGAMGGVETSADDYAKWVAFLLSAWPARDGPETGPVRRSTVREIVTGSNFVGPRTRPGTRRSALPPGRRPTAWAGSVIDDCDLGRRRRSTPAAIPATARSFCSCQTRASASSHSPAETYGAPALPAFRAALALQKSGALREPPAPDHAWPDRRLRRRQGRMAQPGDITAAPLANNVLMDRDRAAWSKLISAI